MSTQRRRWIRRVGLVLVVAVVAPLTTVVGVADAALLATEGRSGTLVLAPGASGSVTVNCRSSAWGAVSGGFSAAVANDVLISASQPSPLSNGWSVSAVNLTTTTQTVQVLALCAVIDGRVVRSRTALVAPTASPDVTATCPAGTTSTGGGHRIDPVNGLPVVSSRPAANGSGWTVNAFNVTAASRTVTAFTVCAVFNGRQVTATNTNLEPGTAKTVTATCPTNKVAIGGGWAHGGGVRWLVDRAMQQSVAGFPVHFVNNTTTVRFGVTAFVVCSSVGPIPSAPPPAG